MNRKKRQAERLAILMEIERLNEHRCDACTKFANPLGNSSMCSCDAAVEIRKMGKLLMKTTEREKREIQPKINEDQLTAENYVVIKSRGIKDGPIAKHFQMSVYKLKIWKRENGLFGIKAKRIDDEYLSV